MRPLPNLRSGVVFGLIATASVISGAIACREDRRDEPRYVTCDLSCGDAETCCYYFYRFTIVDDAGDIEWTDGGPGVRPDIRSPVCAVPLPEGGSGPINATLDGGTGYCGQIPWEDT